MRNSASGRTSRIASLAAISIALLSLSLPAGATGWTWMNPVPFGVPLTTVCQSASGEVLASGPDSAFLRRTATGWETLPTEISVEVKASMTAADGSTFAAGRVPGENAGALVRWSGRNWAKAAQGDFPFSVLWALSAREAWVGGKDAFGSGAWVGRFDGSAIKATQLDQREDMEVVGIWASSSSDVWALVHSVNDAAVRLFRFDGVSWAEESIKDIDKTINPAFLWGSGTGKPILVGSGKGGLAVAEKGSAGWAVTKTFDGAAVRGVSGTPDGTLGIAATSGSYDERIFLARRGGVWTDERVADPDFLMGLSGTPSNGFLSVTFANAVVAKSASGWTSLTPTFRDDNFNDVVRMPNGTLLLPAKDPLTGEGRVVRRETDGRFTDLLTVPNVKVDRVRVGPDGTLWAVANDYPNRAGYVYRGVAGNWTLDLTRSDFPIVDVFPMADGAIAAAYEYVEGEHGPTPGKAHILKRDAAGKWTEEWTSDVDLGISFLFPWKGSVAFPGFEVTDRPGEIGRCTIHVREASGWTVKADIADVIFSGTLPAPDGTTLLVGHDNNSQLGVVHVFDGTHLTRVAMAPNEGQVFLFGIAPGSGGYFLPGFSSDTGARLYFWDGKVGPTETFLTDAAGAPASVPFFSIAAGSPTEIWMAGSGGALMKFDGGSDVAAGRTPGVTVTRSAHRPSLGADLAGWYDLVPAPTAVSDLMDLFATTPSGGWAELQFRWTAEKAIPASSLRLWSVADQTPPQQLFLDPGAFPAPEGAFELLDPSGVSIPGAGCGSCWAAGTTTLAPGTTYTVRFTLRDGGFARYDLDPRPGILRATLLLTTY